MPASIFNGQKVKTLKDTLTLNGKSDIISSTVDPTASAVDAPIGSLLINQTSGKLYRKLDAGSSVNWEEVGAGVGGINYILNPSAEVNTTGWATYADAAGTAPVDGTGGSPSVTWTRSTTTPLRGVADFNFAKDAANRQGQGVSYDFTIALADKAKVLSVTFDYEVLSGTYADGDLTVYLIADPAGTPVVIQPAGYTVLSATSGTTMRQRATFQTQATGTSYRLCFHVASTSASAYTLAIDNVVVGPQQTVQGAAISDWQSYTPVMTGGTASTISGRWARVGDSVHVRVIAVLSAGGVYSVSLPFSVDATKFPNNTSNAYYGMASYSDVSANVSYVGMPYFPTSTTVRFYGPNTTEWSATTPAAFGAGDAISIDLFYPVSGWSSNVVMSQDTDTRVVAFKAWATGNTVVANSSETAITFASSILDTHSGWNGTNSYTAPVSGYYRVSVSYLAFAASAVGARYAIVSVGGSSPNKNFIDRVDNPSGTAVTYLSGSTIVQANAGDAIQIKAFQASGGSMNVGADANVSIERISGPATIAASETVAARYKTLAGNSVTSGTVNYIDFATKVFDTHGLVSVASPAGNKTVTNTGWKATIPVSGRYQITASGLSAAGGGWAAGEEWSMLVIKNGSTYSQNSNVSQATHSTYVQAMVSSVIECIAGDRIEIGIYQNSGSAVNMDVSVYHSFVDIIRVGN